MHIHPIHIVLLCLGLSLAPSTSAFAQKNKREKKSSDTELAEKDRIKSDNLFFNGLKEIAIGNAEVAIDKLESCVAINPKNDAALFELSKLYGQNGNLTKSKQACINATQIDPENIYYLDLLAGIELTQGNTKGAVKVYEQIIDLQPTNPTAYMAMAQLYEANNNEHKAEEYYQLAQTKSGADVEILGQRIDHYIAINNLKKALIIANKMVALVPNEPDLLLLRADILSKLGKGAEAKQALKDILVQFPEHGNASFALAQLYYQEKNIDECLKLMAATMGDPSLSADPKMEVLLQILSDPESVSYNRDLIYELCKSAIIAHSDDPRVYSVYGDFLNRDGNIEAAKDNFKKAVALAPDKFLIWEQIIFIEFALNQFEEVRNTCEQAIALFPNNAAFYLYASYAYAELKENDKRIASLEEGLQYVIGDAAQRSTFYSTLGDAYHDKNDYKKSEEYYDKALSIAPKNAAVLNNYAYNLSLRSTSLEKARTLSYQSLEIDPNNPLYQDTYAWILYKMERYEEALEYITKALKQNPNDGEIFDHCGDIYYKLGNVKFALDNWKKAKSLGYTSENLDFKIKELRLK